MTNTNEKILNWFQKETSKDEMELNKIKEDIVKSIKNVDKNEIFTNTKKEKLTLWRRLKKVLTGI
jgi:hypothetical protein